MATEAERARAHLTVTGRVQGVFFRASTRDAARRIGGISGWVRNLPDGRVEAVAEGPRQNVRQLVAWCRNGPPHARVDDLTVEWQDPTNAAGPFTIRL